MDLLNRRQNSLFRPPSPSPDRSVIAARLVIGLIASAAIVVVALLTAQQVSHERQVVEAAIRAETRARVLSFHQHVLRTLNVAEVALQDLIDETGQGQDWLYKPEDFKDRIVKFPHFDAIMVDIPGKPLVSTEPNLELSAAALTGFRNLAKSRPDRPNVTIPVESTGGRKVAIVRQLEIPSGGYAAILLDPRSFTDFANYLDFGELDLISLIGLDGVTRARRTGRRFSTGETVAGLVMERQRAEPNGNYIGPSVLDGIPRFFSHQRLEKYPLFTTSGIPTAALEQRIAERRETQLAIMAAAILAILLAASVADVAFRRSQARVRDLLQSNTRLNEAQRIGSMGDWDYYPETDQLHWSQNLRRMYHRMDESEVSGIADVARYIREEDLAKITHLVSDIMSTGEPAQWEVVATLADGSESCRRVVAAPIFDEDRKVIGVHGTDQDVTTEMKVRQIEERIGELARLDSMNALAATLAHELNQPLAIAANYLAAAVRSLPHLANNANALNYLVRAQGQIDHLGQIIVGARELVAHSETTVEDIVLSVVFRETFQLLRDAVSNAPFSASEDIADNARMVRTNRTQLKQVLFNLARNAIEASPEEQIPSLLYKARRIDATTIQIELHDNGTGMSAKHGDPFAAMSTSKQSGMGLGLPLARTIVEFHGGKIWIERSGQSGTVIAFTVRSATPDA